MFSNNLHHGDISHPFYRHYDIVLRLVQQLTHVGCYIFFYVKIEVGLRHSCEDKCKPLVDCLSGKNNVHVATPKSAIVRLLFLLARLINRQDVVHEV